MNNSENNIVKCITKRSKRLNSKSIWCTNIGVTNMSWTSIHQLSLMFKIKLSEVNRLIDDRKLTGGVTSTYDLGFQHLLQELVKEFDEGKRVFDEGKALKKRS